jgi:hypothetical protein
MMNWKDLEAYLSYVLHLAGSRETCKNWHVPNEIRSTAMFDEAEIFQFRTWVVYNISFCFSLKFFPIVLTVHHSLP